MKVFCSPNSLSWTHFISPSLKIPHSFSVGQTNRFRVFCGAAQYQKANQMTISVTGATGFIGKRLVQRLHAENHNARVLTRSGTKAELIFPDKKIKTEIEHSRILVTSKVVDLTNNSSQGVQPNLLVSATAVGYYGLSSETEVFDESSPSRNDYLAEVCREWEATALKANKDVRLAQIRIGMVLGKDGGALAKMIPLLMMFAGGPLGSGTAMVFLDSLGGHSEPNIGSFIQSLL